MATIPDLLSVPEVAQRLRCTERNVWKLLSACELDAVRVGGRTLVRVDSLVALIERSTERAIVLKPTVRQSARSRRAGSA